MDHMTTLQQKDKDKQAEEHLRQQQQYQTLEQDVTARSESLQERESTQEKAKKEEREQTEDRKREVFNSRFEVLRPQDTAPSPQAYRPSMENKKERKAFYNEQKKKAKKNEGGLLSEEELEKIEALRQSSWGQQTWMRERKKGSKYTQKDLYEQAMNGEFKDFEHLDVPLRNALATRWMRENFIRPQPGQSVDDYVQMLVREKGVEGLMHPLFRLGVSLAMRSGFEGMSKNFFVELDCKCCSEIMVRTLTKQVSSEERERMIREHPQRDKKKAAAAVDADILRNQASQIFMAKNLLLMHMSSFSLIQNKQRVGDWPYDVSAAFGHCSRVMFNLPALRNKSREEQQRHRVMWSALREVRASHADPMKGNACGIFRRGASTHDFQRRSVVQRDGKGELKEKKKLANFFGQEGLNVAIGGLYNGGVNGRPLLNDGSCGHIYFMRKQATTNLHGGYMIGFESDAYKKTNQLGHRHGFGNGEYASSFGGQRVDEIGDKYGGRVCDLGYIPPEVITARLLQLERYMRRAMSEGEDMSEIMRKLAGKHMTRHELDEFFNMIREKTEELESRNPERYSGDIGVYQ